MALSYIVKYLSNYSIAVPSLFHLPYDINLFFLLTASNEMRTLICVLLLS